MRKRRSSGAEADQWRFEWQRSARFSSSASASTPARISKGGRMLDEGFLTPETIRAVEPELAAMSEAIAAVERDAATA
jgi:hypothetical protein